MKVKILANTRKSWASSLSRSLSSFLRSHGISISHSSADVTLCIGGDGTIFHYSYFGKTSGSILGIEAKPPASASFNTKN